MRIVSVFENPKLQALFIVKIVRRFWMGTRGLFISKTLNA
jgi:hypothetical protein